MRPTVPPFVGLDYSRHAVQVCVLDPAGNVPCNRAVPDNAGDIDQAVRRLDLVRTFDPDYFPSWPGSDRLDALVFDPSREVSRS